MRRQPCTCCGRQPWRRAISVTTAPGRKLSTTICAFSSSGQRFRPTPAYTSIRGGNGRLMSSEGSSIMSTLAENDSLAVLKSLRTNNLKGFGATLTVKRQTRRRNRAQGTTLSRPAQPNELWCADYKGEFMLADRRYCYPLTITDFAS